MAERLNLQQANAVAAYLSREIVATGNPQKLVRLGHEVAIGPEQYHSEVAEAARLKLLETTHGWRSDDDGCHDGAIIQFLNLKNRLVLYGTTTLTLITPEGGVVPDVLDVEYDKWSALVNQCRQVTCLMFVAVVNLLPSHPEFFSTISDHIEDAQRQQT